MDETQSWTIRKINRGLSVSPQIAPADMAAIEDGGFSFDHLQPPRRRRADQPTFAEIEKAAKAAGLDPAICPSCRQGPTRMPAISTPSVRSSRPGARLLPHRHALGHALVAGQGARGTPLPTSWPPPRRRATTCRAWCAASPMAARRPPIVADASHDIVIVGGGAAGHFRRLSSLLARKRPTSTSPSSTPQDIHYYQPGWTMVGGGIFEARNRQDHGHR
jgi:sulfide:quinone oxidoreductase